MFCCSVVRVCALLVVLRYAIIVHTGATANSGHYFLYARNSSAPDLHLPDSKWSPWIKFNDTRVTRTTWAQLVEATSSSVTDCAYVLLFRRLSGAPQPPMHVSTSAAEPLDEDEELRRAMTMSIEESKTGSEDPAARDASAGAGGARLRPWLQRVVHDNARCVCRELPWMLCSVLFCSVLFCSDATC